jgi:hypothetical protein
MKIHEKDFVQWTTIAIKHPPQLAQTIVFCVHFSNAIKSRTSVVLSLQPGLKRYPDFLGFDVFAGVAGRQGSHCCNLQNTKPREADKAESPISCPN